MVKAIKEMPVGTILIGIKTAYKYFAVGGFNGIGAVHGDETVEITNQSGDVFTLCFKEKGSKTVVGDRIYSIGFPNNETIFLTIDKASELFDEELAGVKSVREAFDYLYRNQMLVRKIYDTLLKADIKKL